MKLFAAALVLAAVAALAPREAVAAPPPEHAARHILVSYKGATRSTQPLRTKEEARVLATKALEAIKSGRPFADVSHEFSDDKYSDAKGGFLDFFTPDAVDPRFWAAVDAAKDGELVGPVESDFGFHVIQRLSPADAIAILAASSTFVRGALFAWKGATGSLENRSKELALEDAGRALARLATVRDFGALPPELGAQSFPKPQWIATSIQKGMFRPELAPVETAALALKVGELTAKPIETPYGWIICERIPYFRIHVEHLVVLHKGAPNGAGQGVTRTKDEAKARAGEALAKLKAAPATWPALVAEYSDEPEAGPRQGSLGGVEPGAMFPEFEAAFVKLAPGAFSELVETPFGWHVIHRVD